MEAKSKYIKVDLFAVAPGVWGMRDVFVNVYAILNPSDNNWFLVDAGVKWSAPKIKRMAELLFGAGSKPAAIILTHGHFDHVGSLAKLATEWDIQVYAHHLEMPYLTGVSSYPPPDPTVGGGILADLSFFYPKTPINIEDRIISLPQGGLIPGLPEWRYIHTPGHSPGHISLFRDADKVLISGDAIVTTKQESALSVMFQFKKLSGPPKYFTSDWLSAAASVEALEKLEPEVIASGHGRPIRGAGLRKSLHNLVRDFVKVAVPAQGRYVHQPALSDDTGVVHLPPKNRNANAAPTLKLLGIAAGLLITMMLVGGKKKKKKKDSELSDVPVKKGKKAIAEEKKLDKIKDSARDKWSKGKDEVEEEYDTLKDKGSKQLKNFKSNGKEELQDLKKSGKKEWNELKDSGKKGYENLKDAGKEEYDDLKHTGKKEIKHLAKSGESKLDDVKEAGKDVYDDLRQAGKKELKQLAKSGKTAFNDVKDAGQKEIRHLAKSGKQRFEDVREPVWDAISHLKFPLRKSLKKLRK